MQPANIPVRLLVGFFVMNINNQFIRESPVPCPVGKKYFSS